MPEWFMIQNQKGIMKNQCILFQRSGVYFSKNSTDGKRANFRTRDKTEALCLLIQPVRRGFPFSEPLGYHRL
jgi:hypothetical protein